MNPTGARFVAIDDGAEDAYLLVQLFDRCGVADVPVYHTGEAALEALEAFAAADGSHPMPAAIFIDVGLPGMSGFDVLKWVRQHPRLRSTVVILLSGSEEPRNLGKARQLGADCFMVKFPSLSIMRDVLAEARKVAVTAIPRSTLQVSCNLLLTATTGRVTRSPFPAPRPAAKPELR